jgi:hypothetical protein
MRNYPINFNFYKPFFNGLLQPAMFYEWRDPTTVTNEMVEFEK